jgi:hypothetical protein
MCTGWCRTAVAVRAKTICRADGRIRDELPRRERMFEYFSREYVLPVAILRLNYAVEMRYGVLADLARRVFRSEPIDLTMGYVNVIWQADANAMAIGALAHACDAAADRESCGTGGVERARGVHRAGRASKHECGI